MYNACWELHEGLEAVRGEVLTQPIPASVGGAAWRFSELPRLEAQPQAHTETVREWTSGAIIAQINHVSEATPQVRAESGNAAERIRTPAEPAEHPLAASAGVFKDNPFWDSVEVEIARRRLPWWSLRRWLSR